MFKSLFRKNCEQNLKIEEPNQQSLKEKQFKNILSFADSVIQRRRARNIIIIVMLSIQ